MLTVRYLREWLPDFDSRDHLQPKTAGGDVPNSINQKLLR